MTGSLRKFTHKDLNAVVDAAQKYSVGFDDLFYRLHSYGTGSVNDAYPPYNIVEESNIKWRIEVALAGWSKDEVEVTTESNVLLIKSKTAKSKGEEEYMHRGISSRSFARGFNLSDDVEIVGLRPGEKLNEELPVFGAYVSDAVLVPLDQNEFDENFKKIFLSKLKRI